MTRTLRVGGGSEGGLRVGYMLRMYPRFSQTFVANEIAELERQGVEVFVLSLRTPKDEPVHEAASRVRAPVEYLPKLRTAERKSALGILAEPWRSDRPRLAAAFRSLRSDPTCDWDDFVRATRVVDWVRRHRLDHVHVHFGTSEATVALMANLLGDIPYSLTLHAFDIFRETVDLRLLARKINHSRFTVTVTEFNRQYLVEHAPGLDVRRLRVNYNGVSVQRFAVERAPSSKPTLFALGRLIEKKGFAHLVAALARVREQGLAVRCRIGGDGPERAALSDQIARSGLSGLVELLGPLSESQVREEFRRATCFVLPCIRAKDGNVDALPTVLLEAQASGCPVITTRLSGNPEIVEDRVSGLLVEPGDEEGLARAIRDIVLSPTLAETLGLEGRRRAEKRFDIRRNVAVMHDWFQQAAQNETASRRRVAV